MNMASKENVNTKKSTIVILGAGIIGLTTAYELSKVGHFNVHVIEKRNDVCKGASYQNGGVVNVESIAPVNSYMSLWKTIQSSVISYVTGEPTNSMIRPSALLEPNLLLWVKHFMLNSSKDKIKYHSEGMRQIGATITPLMEEMFECTGFDRQSHNFHYTPGLILSSVKNPEAYVHSKRNTFDEVFKKKYITGKDLEKIKSQSGIRGLDESVVDNTINVGCLEPNNITVNTKTLGDSLKQYLLENGVQFTFGREVNLVTNSNDDKIKHLKCDDGSIICGDSFVVCCGYDSNRLLKSIGMAVPLVPIKAYSLHINSIQSAVNWRYAVHIQAESGVAGLYTPYREGQDLHSLRITGIRDMDGVNPIERPERLKALMQVAQRYYNFCFCYLFLNII